MNVNTITVDVRVIYPKIWRTEGCVSWGALLLTLRKFESSIGSINKKMNLKSS